MSLCKTELRPAPFHPWTTWAPTAAGRPQGHFKSIHVRLNSDSPSSGPWRERVFFSLLQKEPDKCLQDLWKNSWEILPMYACSGHLESLPKGKASLGSWYWTWKCILREGLWLSLWDQHFRLLVRSQLSCYISWATHKQAAISHSQEDHGLLVVVS